MHEVLRAGSSGQSVAYLQERLTTLGFLPGPVDGKLGSRTALAVRQFQASEHLQVDGIVGDRTWAALDVSAQNIAPHEVRTEARSLLLSRLRGQRSSEGVAAVLDAAIGTLGWAETPLGSNDGPEVGRITRGYYSPTDEVKYGLPPWCALAICYWMREGLDVQRYADIPLGARLGGVSQIERWGKANDRFIRSRVATVAQPGSIFTMSRLGSGSDPSDTVRSGHCGFILADEGAWVTTIEGNSGNAVRSRRRRKSSFRGWVTWW